MKVNELVDIIKFRRQSFVIRTIYSPRLLMYMLIYMKVLSPMKGLFKVIRTLSYRLNVRFIFVWLIGIVLNEFADR